ncbi:MAG UNVERIFIED_CONTAM: hypothetical protein LVR18_51650 [Planctomycetaceae bacterium]|jgi:hypothetical protein
MSLTEHVGDETEVTFESDILIEPRLSFEDQVRGKAIGFNGQYANNAEFGEAGIAFIRGIAVAEQRDIRWSDGGAALDEDLQTLRADFD